MEEISATWQCAGIVAAFIAAFGVVVSLIFVGRQTQSLSKSIRAEAYRELMNKSADLSKVMLSSPDLDKEIFPEIFKQGCLYTPARDEETGDETVQRYKIRKGDQLRRLSL